MERNRIIFMVVLSFVVAAGLAQPNYDYSLLLREKLGRGVVAVRESASAVCVSWRYLSSDPVQTTFNVYRDGAKIAEVPANAGTFYRDEYVGYEAAIYTVKAVYDGEERKDRGETYTLYV